MLRLCSLEGVVNFKATCEGAVPGPSLPTKYNAGGGEEDSNSSDNSISQQLVLQQQQQASPPATTLATVTATTVAGAHPQPILLPPSTSAQQPEIIFAVPVSIIGHGFIQSAPTTAVVTGGLMSTSGSTSTPTPIIPRQKSVKKFKTKQTCKPKTIKFHEYKGPPNSREKASQAKETSESSYELLLQQQQLFLQWQLEWQHRVCHF